MVSLPAEPETRPVARWWLEV